MESATPFHFTTSAVVGPVNANGFVWVHGISVRETGGATALVVTLRENSSSGNIVGEFAVAASGSLPPACLPRVKVNGSVYVAVSGGTASGVLYIS